MPFEFLKSQNIISHSMKKNTCKLCLENKDLRNSHILPEFMYQNLYNLDVKRFNSFEINLDKLEDSKKRIEQKGIREYLLCQSCETLLSKYENYAAETLYSKNLKNKAFIVEAKETPDQKYFTYDYEGFDYKNFRLFLLSILWRLIISKSFKTPNIDCNLTEELRIAILNENPLKYDQFGCLVQSIFYKKGQLVKGFILSPYVTGKNNEILNILIDGFMFSFFLNNTTEKDKTFFLKENGTMVVFGRVIFEDENLFKRLKTAFDFFK